MSASLFLLVLNKDLRRFLPWASLVVAMTLLNRFLAPHVIGSHLQALTQWTSLLPWPLALISGLLLGQEDRAIGDQAFWHTRPIPGLTLVAAKFTALLLFVVLPAAAADVIRAAQHDVHGSTLALIGLERVLYFGPLTTVGLYLGATNRSLLRCLAAVVAVALTVFVILFSSDSIRLDGRPLDLIDPAVSSNDRLVVGFGGFLLLSGALSIALYHTRRAHFLAIVAALGTVVVTLATVAWPYPLLSTPGDAVHPGPDVPAAIDLRIEAPLTARVTGQSNARDPEVNLALSARASVSPRATILGNLQATAKITLPDGKVRQFNDRSRKVFIVANFLTVRALRDPFSIPEERSRGLPDFLSMRGLRLPLHDLIAFTGQPMALDLDLNYEAYHARWDQRVPLSIGARGAREGTLVEVTDIQTVARSDGLRLQILNSHATSVFAPFGTLRPDQLVYTGIRDSLVLINRMTGAVSTAEREGRHYSSRTDDTFPAESQWLVFRHAYLPGTTDPNTRVAVDDTWREHSDIVFLHTEPLGPHTQSYHFDAVKIPRPVLELSDEEIDLRNW